MSAQNPLFYNYVGESLAAKSYAATAHEGAALDHSLYGPCASFYISVGTVGSSATVDMKLQYSDNGTNWTDYSDSVNDTAITQITEAGATSLTVYTPYGRYSRAHVTVGTAACVLAVIAISPKRHQAA